MSSTVPLDPKDVVVNEDRYSGVYSGGAYWAIAYGDKPLGELDRLTWLLEHGPDADDITAALFWARPPNWIAVGATAKLAIDRLLQQHSLGDDVDWQPPRLEDDPRYSS